MDIACIQSDKWFTMNLYFVVFIFVIAQIVWLADGRDDVCELYVCVNDMLLGEMVVLCAHIMCDVISESSYYNESTAMKPLFLLEI